MNRILLTTAALVTAAILSVTIFVSFFAVQERTHAFVVIAPADAATATALSSMTQTATRLAGTDTFRALFLSDLTASGTVYSEQSLTQTVVVRDTPGLVRVIVPVIDGDDSTKIATSGAYALTRLVNEYYGATAQYAVNVIDGAPVQTVGGVSQPVGVILSIALGVLITALVFLVVFSFHASRRSRRTHTTHASHARLNLQSPKMTPQHRTLHQTAQQMAPAYDPSEDYMRNIYTDYDAELERQLAEMEASASDQAVVATQNVQEQIIAQTTPAASDFTPEENADLEELIDDVSYALHPEQPVEQLVVPKAEKAEDEPQKKAPQKQPQRTGESQKLSDLMASMKTRVNAAVEKTRTAATESVQSAQKTVEKAVEKAVTPKKETKQEVKQEKQVAEKKDVKQDMSRMSAAQGAAPASLPVAPANLPIMQTPTAAPANLPVASAAADTTDDAEQREPTPAEIRKRLNDLLSGKPPKISE